MSEQKKRRQKVSGHGSVSKAGKVRMQTPKIPPSVKHSKKSFPRYRNRRNFEKRVKLKRQSGQNWMEEGRRGRGRGSI